MIKKFKKPIYVSSPIFPDLNEYNNRLKEIWQSGFISNNWEKVISLEKKLAKKLDVPYLSLYNNGTSALFAAVRYLRLSGEVITTPFTFASTPHVLTLQNIKPVFCDIDQQTMNINPDKIEELITPRTTGILGVHVFGVPCDVNKIKKIASSNGLKIIYDAAHAFGSEVDGVGIGNYGDMSIFSFHATKLFHTAEGGGVVCKNKYLKKKIDIIRNFGIENNESIIEVGFNGKMSEIHAALGLEVQKCLDQEMEKRKNILNIYHQRLSGQIGIVFNNFVGTSLQYFIIRINKQTFGRSRDEVCELFKKYNIFTRKYFYPLCSNFPHYKSNVFSSKKRLPIANQVADEVLALPFHGKLSSNDVHDICDILVSFKKNT